MNTSLPQGFRLAVTSAGFHAKGRNDLALAVSDRPATAAGLFTRNLFQAAPVQIGKRVLQERETVRAVLINTGQANACTGEEGLSNCRRTQELVAAAAGLEPWDILPASTGVIGVQLKMDAWEGAVAPLIHNLGQARIEDFAEAIMTTDAFPKYAGESFSLKGGVVTLAGVAKGAGMICPDMATMLSLVLCDAEVYLPQWRAMLRRVADRTFNRVSVDGDTSTNDTLYGLANGASGVRIAGPDLEILEDALVRVLSELAYKLVQDGEGASKVMRIHVHGTKDNADAERIARSVGHSQLVKTAMYGKDANWGRIVCAAGRAGVELSPSDLRVSLCGVDVFLNGQPAPGDFDALLRGLLEQRDIHIDIAAGEGPGEYCLLASDLTHEYININAEYRT